MTDNEALLQAVCTDPDNVGLRLIYADYLEEQGDARADFIRVQCDLADLSEDDDRVPALKERELQLLNRHGRAWVQELELAHNPCTFRRGFVEALTMSADDFLASAERLFQKTPLRELRLTSTGAHTDGLAASPWLARLGRLRIAAAGDVDAVALCASPHLQNLHALNLGGFHLGMGCIRALVAGFAQLRELGLHGCQQMGAAEAEILAREGHFRELECLSIDGMRLGTAGLHALAATRHWPKLRTMRLVQCNGMDSGVRTLAMSPFFPELHTLNLSGNELHGESLQALADSPQRAALRHLDLSFNKVGAAALRSLGASRSLGNLRKLLLHGCGLAAAIMPTLVASVGKEMRSLHLGANFFGHEGAERLAKAAHLADLRELHLDACELTAWSVKSLLWSPHLGGLRLLNVSHNDLGDQVLLALGACPPHPYLHTLNLGSCKIGDEGIAAIQNWPNLPALRSLVLDRNPLGDDGARQLANSALLDRLVHLDLSGTGMTSAGVAVLLDSPRAGRLQSLRLEGISLDDGTRQRVRARFFGQGYLRG